MKITIGAENLYQFFSPEAKIYIPSFQRNYAWGTENLDQFLEDIFDSVRNKSQHFFGPIVVLNPENDVYQVIDGQQRITTAVMTLAIARDCLYDEDLFSTKKMQQGPHEVDLETPFKQALFNGDFQNVPKFHANHFLQEYFEERVIFAPSPDRPEVIASGKGLPAAAKQTTKEFRKAYLHIREKIQEFFRSESDEQERKSLMIALHNALTKNFQVLTLQLSEEDDAYELFENLNHRGVKLAPSDLLKTLTLRDIRLQGVSEFDKALAVWDDIIEEQLSGTAEFTQFLRYYLLTQIDKPIQASRIYKEFKEIIKNSGPGGAQKNLDSLSKSATYYSKLIGVNPHDNEILKNSFLRLNIIGQTHKVLLMRAMQSQLSETQLLKISRAVEVLSFRWIVAGQNAQILENHFRNKAHQINIGFTDDQVNALCSDLISLAPIDDRLQDIHNSGSEIVARYALQSIESVLGAGYFAWENPTTLEHLAPRNPGQNSDHWHSALKVEERAVANELTPEIEYSTSVHKWGNLSLLEFTLNSTIKNSQWHIKRDGVNPAKDKCLKTSGFTINTPLKNLDSWTIENIEARGIWIRDAILKLRSLNWVETGAVSISNWTN